MGVLIFMCSCENDIQQVNAMFFANDSAQMSGKVVEMTYTTNGKLSAKMNTPLLRQLPESDGTSTVEFPNGIEVFYYDSVGEIKSRLRADYSIYYENQGLWIAKNNVEVVNENGEKLNTEYMVWDRNKETISSDQDVRITNDEGVIYGSGFVSDQRFSQWEVQNGRGIINVNTDE